MGETTKDSNAAIWEEIELSESYLVSSNYEKAATLASSVIKTITNNNSIDIEATELEDMLESAGMVLVQSLSQLGRTQVVLKELKSLFVSAESIPIQLLIAGACLQISEGSTGVREFLEEFLGKWSCLDGRYYSIDGSGQGQDLLQKCEGRYVLEVDRYVEVVEIYSVTLLGKNLKDLDSAISWIEKAELPEERRQVGLAPHSQHVFFCVSHWTNLLILTSHLPFEKRESSSSRGTLVLKRKKFPFYVQLLFTSFIVQAILRKLHSLYSLQTTNPLQGVSVLPQNNNGSHYFPSKELNLCEDSSKVVKVKYPPNMENDMKRAILKLPNQKHPLWWFRSINLKLGNAQLVITNGKIMLGCLFILVYWVIRKKRVSLKGIVTRQLSSIKKGLVDLWQLAFSYQVNPLAAVQPLPAASHGGRR